MNKKILFIVACSFVAILISSIAVNAISDANNATSKVNKSLGSGIGLQITVKDSKTGRVLTGCIVTAKKLPSGPTYMLYLKLIGGVYKYYRTGLPCAYYDITASKPFYRTNTLRNVPCLIDGVTYLRDIPLTHI